MARAAGVKKSPYQNSAQTQPQSAKAKTFARRKKITPRRLGMGRMYCFASATAAERRTHPSRCTVQSSVDDRDAAAELVVERLSAEIEQGQHETEQAERAREHREQGARERHDRSERLAFERAEPLPGERHTRGPAPEGHEHPRPGERKGGTHCN